MACFPSNKDWFLKKFSGNPDSIRIGQILSRTYTNIDFESLVDNKWMDLKGLYSGTTMQRLFEDGSIDRSRFKTHLYSDFIRMLLLYKIGGLYMDMDVITTRPFDESWFPKNFAMFQSRQHINGAILKFAKHSCFMRFHMENMVDKYGEDVWGSEGPLRLTETFQIGCESWGFQDQDVTPCSVNQEVTRRYHCL